MPTSLHPQAKFDPIPPDLDLYGLVDRTPNLKWVQRVSRNQIRNLGQQEFEKVVLMHVIVGGKPLVIDGWDAVLPQWLFNAEWLEKTYDKKQENVRDIGTASDMPMTTGHYLRSMKTLTNQWTPTNFRDERRQRLYLKDIDCPVEWHDALQKALHPSLFYLNENVSGEAGNRSDEDDIFRSDASAAPAGDLMSSLPEEMRAQNLMCYIGHEGTYTPAHREMCASLGQNIMVEASDGTRPDEKLGSSVWFMTESKDREVVREYFLSMLGHDIEIEKHFAQINAWKKAPFDVYVVDQRRGDFILIPPLAAHQVWNRGTRTMKVAWNRTTPETLHLALHEALPKARLVCRDEQYKNKAIIYFTLSKYYKQLQDLEENAELTQMSFMGFGQDIVKNSPRAKQLVGDFKKLWGLFKDILVDEMFAYKEKDVEFLKFDSCVTCSYCRSNIFNRFLTCKNCVRTLINGDEDAYDVCMECYAMGRSCVCLSGLRWCEQWSWTELVNDYEAWRAMVIKNDGFVDFENSPQPLEVARQRAGKKTVAQICQEALRRRPWKDITKQDLERAPSDSEPDAAEGKPKKLKRKRKKGDVRRCHTCSHKDYHYRVHECTNPGCSEAYCYGVLYRAFDMMPQQVLEDEQWQCPKCLGICNCGACRRAGNTDPYTPKNTLLGHDTRPIADDRSVEALVDFRLHNLSWLRATGEDSRSKDSKRMQHLREQANNAKAEDVAEQEAGGTLHTNGDAADAHDISANGAAASGYGDQSSVFNRQGASQPEHHELEQLRVAIMGEDENAQGAMHAPGEEHHDTSLYPDPALVAHQRIGMGYYEQDDTPDKILFDPYKAPSADAIRMDQSDVPEFLVKSIRAAKRKARRENDDPDFAIGKRHYKKQRAAREPEPQPDPLNSMDPALFNNGLCAPETVMKQAPTEKNVHRVQDEPVGEEENGARQRLGPQQGHATSRYDPSELSLRNARPRISYAEYDEAEVEDDDEEDLVVPRKQGEAGSKDAVDLAADAARAIFGQPEPSQATNTPKAKQEESVGQEMPKKRRGRPPKRLSAITQQQDAETPQQSTKAPTDDSSAKTRSGRSTRTNLAARGENMDDEAGENEAQDDVQGVGKEQRKDVGETQRRRRGRPRRSGVATITPAGPDADEDEATKTSEPPVKNEGPEEQRPRPRGRPRKSETVTKPGPPKKEAQPDMQFMSMAERMALKGKKFKIGKRKSRGSESTKSVGVSSETPVPRSDQERPQPEPVSGPVQEPKQKPEPSDEGNGSDAGHASPSGRDDGSISPAMHTLKPAAQPLTAPSGRTVVKLADAEESSVSPGPSESDGASSDDDEDIPATRRAPPSRGRGRGRGGRGRARGGRRGRGGRGRC